MKYITIITLHAAFWLAGASTAAAWGPTGHAVIGQVAYERLAPNDRAAVRRVLDVATGESVDAALDEACNWPDRVRETPQWAWSAPLHYVNLPRSDARYQRQRDCPGGLCVTEGVLYYAAALQRPATVHPPAARRQDSTRWQSFAWLCHLVGDLHQPLHAGFADDRGGNRVEVTYRGETYNLHEFWDGVLVRERWSAGDRLPQPAASAAVAFEPGQPARWTEESHRLALELGYPPEARISDAFADRTWTVTRDRWTLAASRLARVLEQVLAPGSE